MSATADLKEFQKQTGYSFSDEKLLEQAFTHSSYANEQRDKIQDYERLEYLGDAVLEICASDHLYHLYPDMKEGELTKKRAAMVCEVALAHCARKINIGEHLLIGKGEEAAGGREREAIIADVLEAVIGAIYLDGGFDAAKGFAVKYVLENQKELTLFHDSKTRLQELAQGDKLGAVEYSITGARGPEHRRIFTAEVAIGGKVMGSGEGTSKKIAEQNAAYQALLKMDKKE